MSSEFADLPRAVVMDPFLTDDWAPAVPDSRRPPASSRMPDLRTTERRRARLAAAFPGEALLIPAGVLRTRSNDIAHRFRPHTAHVWLTGNQLPEAVLLLDDGEATLYVRGRSGPDTKEFWEDRRTGEFWAGPRPSVEEAAEQFGIRCRDLSCLPADLPDRSRTRVFAGVDPELDRLTGGLTQADGALEVEAAALRRVKDEWELLELAGAVHQTLLGFDDCVRDWPLARESGERWLETTFERRARLWGQRCRLQQHGRQRSACLDPALDRERRHGRAR